MFKPALRTPLIVPAAEALWRSGLAETSRQLLALRGPGTPTTVPAAEVTALAAGQVLVDLTAAVSVGDSTASDALEALSSLVVTAGRASRAEG